MFFLMAGYKASAGMGFLAILNVCFAAWVFRGTAMSAAIPAEDPVPRRAGRGAERRRSPRTGPLRQPAGLSAVGNCHHADCLTTQAAASGVALWSRA
jgi:hypothetical protein